TIHHRSARLSPGDAGRIPRRRRRRSMRKPPLTQRTRLKPLLPRMTCLQRAGALLGFLLSASLGGCNGHEGGGGEKAGGGRQDQGNLDFIKIETVEQSDAASVVSLT